MTTEMPSEAIIIELGRLARFIEKNDRAINLPENEKKIIDILDGVNGVFEKIKDLVEAKT